jgi:hypothetical protein
MYLNQPQVIVAARNQSNPTQPRLIVQGEIPKVLKKCAEWIQHQPEGDTIQITLN